MTKVSRINRRTVDAEAASTQFDARELLASLPHLPGVYRMFDAAGERALRRQGARSEEARRRATSRRPVTSRGSPRWWRRWRAWRRRRSRSEGEALLLENNLIKALEPRYNILFRDDKSYPYVCMSGDPFPQLRFHRGALDRKHRYFGPFPSAGAVRDGIALLQKVFQLRTCENTVFANRSRPCMLHQIQRCTAPCVGLDLRGRLREDVQGATAVPAGQDRRGARAAQAADGCGGGGAAVRARGAHPRQDRAAAAAAVAAVRRERDRRRHRRRRGGASSSDLFAVNVVMIRGGRHVGDRTFFPRHADAVDDGETSCTAFLAQHYVERPVPPTIDRAGGDGDVEALAEVLYGAIGAQGRDRRPIPAASGACG